jgi:hypothetical protein
MSIVELLAPLRDCVCEKSLARLCRTDAIGRAYDNAARARIVASSVIRNDDEPNTTSTIGDRLHNEYGHINVRLDEPNERGDRLDVVWSANAARRRRRQLSPSERTPPDNCRIEKSRVVITEISANDNNHNKQCSTTDLVRCCRTAALATSRRCRAVDFSFSRNDNDEIEQRIDDEIERTAPCARSIRAAAAPARVSAARTICSFVYLSVYRFVVVLFCLCGWCVVVQLSAIARIRTTDKPTCRYARSLVSVSTFARRSNKRTEPNEWPVHR